MTSPAPQMYPPQQMPPQQLQYQPAPPYPNPYSPSATLYANSLISAYGQLPAPPPPPQPYVYDQPTVGVKRSSDDVDLLSKRPRPDSGWPLAFYPQRPGEKLCAFYMTTRTCSFGLTCKFDHPSWVPYGGIPNWKEVTGSANAPITTDPATLPQRSGEQNCSFYMKTGECKYGPRCKFNHPKERHAQTPDSTLQMKEDAVPAVQNGGSDVVSIATPAITATTGAIMGTSSAPAIAEKGSGKVAPLNSKGLPLRQNETDCTFYIKTGSCKFGATCRFNHPEVIRAGGRPGLPVAPAQNIPVSTVPPISYTNQEGGMMMTPFHPQRPGGPDCTYYLKTGECSFGATCKFHHPFNRQPSIPKAAPKLTMAGLPRREGETVCAYYMKTGACKYGSTCRFDHPPPGEVAAKAAADATRTEVPPMLEAYDVHQSQGVPMQYVDPNFVPTMQYVDPNFVPPMQYVDPNFAPVTNTSTAIKPENTSDTIKPENTRDTLKRQNTTDTIKPENTTDTMAY